MVFQTLWDNLNGLAKMKSASIGAMGQSDCVTSILEISRNGAWLDGLDKGLEQRGSWNRVEIAILLGCMNYSVYRWSQCL